jgi:methylmalonyl-CoA mutase
MARSIEIGLPKFKIEEAAARKQAKIDSGEDLIIGVNIFQSTDKYQFDILDIDNSLVREEQIQKIKEIKSTRNHDKVSDILKQITDACSDPSSNILALAIEAARQRATLGEISYALELSFGRYIADSKLVTGVYSHFSKNQSAIDDIRKLSDRFAQLDGRRPRIIVAKLGQDGHDRGARIIATGFADLGFDVDIAPLFQTPEEAAQQACDNDVHVLGISSLAAGHKTLVPQAINALKALGRPDILVVVGGVIPEKDYNFLYESGTAAIFGPGTPITSAAQMVLNKMFERFYPEVKIE